MPIACQRFQIEFLKVRRRRLQDHLELVVMLQPVGIFAVAAILGPPRGLHIGRVPGFRAERAQRRRRMKGARADFHVIGLQDHAAVIRPITLQRQDQALERAFRAHVRQEVSPSSDRSSLRAVRRAGPYRRGRGNQGDAGDRHPAEDVAARDKPGHDEGISPGDRRRCRGPAAASEYRSARRRLGDPGQARLFQFPVDPERCPVGPADHGQPTQGARKCDQRRHRSILVVHSSAPRSTLLRKPVPPQSHLSGTKWRG